MTEQLPRCNEDEHFWPSHAPGEGPAVGAPCKCGAKKWPAPAVPQGAAAEPTREEDEALVRAVGEANLAYGSAEVGTAEERAACEESCRAEDALIARLAALRQSLASAEARDREQEQRIEYARDLIVELTERKEALRRAGGALSNLAFNLAQSAKLDDFVRSDLDACRKAWDAALVARPL